MLKRLGKVNVEKYWNWVKYWEDELEDERWNGRFNSSGRKCLWFGIGVNLGLNCKFFEGVNKDFVGSMGSWYSGDWNSMLLYKYEMGVDLKTHVDRNCFDSKVVLVNLSVDGFLGGEVEFIYGSEVYFLSNGEVIEFDDRVRHGVKKVKNERWSLSFRKVLI